MHVSAPHSAVSITIIISPFKQSLSNFVHKDLHKFSSLFLFKKMNLHNVIHNDVERTCAIINSVNSYILFGEIKNDIYTYLPLIDPTFTSVYPISFLCATPPEGFPRNNTGVMKSLSGTMLGEKTLKTNTVSSNWIPTAPMKRLPSVASLWYL